MQGNWVVFGIVLGVALVALWLTSPLALTQEPPESSARGPSQTEPPKQKQPYRAPLELFLAGPPRTSHD